MYAQHLSLQLNEILTVDKSKDKELEPSFEDLYAVSLKTYLNTFEKRLFL